MNAGTARLLLAGALVAALLYGGKKIVSAMRGIRNNNPGNIELTGDVWQGQVPPEQQTDDRFVQFIAPEYGIRAMARILGNYAARGVNTLAEIAATWAPPHENNTAAYVRALVDHTGFSADRPLTRAEWPAVIAAIIRQENGIQPYDSATLARGVALA